MPKQLTTSNGSAHLHGPPMMMMFYDSIARQSLSNFCISSWKHSSHECRLLFEVHHFSNPLHLFSWIFLLGPWHGEHSSAYHQPCWCINGNYQINIFNLGHDFVMVNPSWTFSIDMEALWKQTKEPVKRNTHQQLGGLSSSASHPIIVGLGICSRPFVSCKQRVGMNSRCNNRQDGVFSHKILNESEEIISLDG